VTDGGRPGEYEFDEVRALADDGDGEALPTQGGGVESRAVEAVP
jgi:hypothetical protein